MRSTFDSSFQAIGELCLEYSSILFPRNKFLRHSVSMPGFSGIYPMVWRSSRNLRDFLKILPILVSPRVKAQLADPMTCRPTSNHFTPPFIEPATRKNTFTQGQEAKRLQLCQNTGLKPVFRSGPSSSTNEVSFQFYQILITDRETLGKPLRKKSAVQKEFCQIAFQPPPPQANGRFVGTIFAENQSIF